MSLNTNENFQNSRKFHAIINSRENSRKVSKVPGKFPTLYNPNSDYLESSKVLNSIYGKFS